MADTFGSAVHFWEAALSSGEPMLVVGAQRALRSLSDVKKTELLLQAFEENWGTVFHALLEAGANPNAAFQDADGTHVPLICAAALVGAVEFITALLDAGADVDAPEFETGETALMAAAAHGNASVVTVLLSRGADPARVDFGSGATALVYAVSKRHSRCIQLLAPVSPVNSVCVGGVSALYLAAENGDAEAVSALIAAGADVALASADDDASRPLSGVTPLHKASMGGHAEVVKVLLQCRGSSVSPTLQWYDAAHVCRHQGAPWVRLLAAGLRRRRPHATGRGEHERSEWVYGARVRRFLWLPSHVFCAQTNGRGIRRGPVDVECG